VRAVLRNRVDEIDAELLVLGSNGRSDLTRIWLGSVAEHFLVHPPCDVLVVKA
jgi:nucleotide-binding universal stress UspA family protein